MDKIIEGSRIITSEQEIHHSLTREFEKNFERQEHYTKGFMSKDVDIDWLMEKSNFMRTYCNNEIEDYNIELIFDAIQHPKDDMIAHKMQSDEIERELNKCPTREELELAIELATKGKAGGPTGATYNMLKLATKELIEDIYKSSRTLGEQPGNSRLLAE